LSRIIALGGGGFSMEPDNLALDRYILKQSGKDHPKVCFLPTASGDSLDYIVRFYAAFTTLNCEPSHLNLIHPSTADLENFILEKDVLYVSGGNTRSMLAIWRGWGVVDILQTAWQNGVLLAGISAGAICWFEQGITDSVPGRLSKLDCLGFLPGSCCPHYDGEPERRPTFHRLIAGDQILPGYGIDDGAAMHFADGELFRVVSSRPQATAFFLEKVAGEVLERPLECEYLGED
jgi:dipeptidase E